MHSSNGSVEEAELVLVDPVQEEDSEMIDQRIDLYLFRLVFMEAVIERDFDVLMIWL